VELTKLFQQFGLGDIGSKQAFSKAQYKIRAEAFIDLNDTFIRAYYEQRGYHLYPEGYLLLASDSLDYELP